MNQYKRMIRAKYYEIEPLVYLYYAEALKAMENYEEAIIQYKAYKLTEPEDKRAENGIRACDSIQSWLENPTKHQIQNLDKINSRASDFAATYGGRTYNTIIFTSTRDDAVGNVKDEWTDQEFSDLFISRVDRQGIWSKPTLLDNEDADVENDNTINSVANEGTPTMSKNFTQMYFTRCPNTIKKASGCQIYTSKRVSRTWSRPQILMLGRDTSAAVGHPTLSSDEKTIYFSAERSGGKGGKDRIVPLSPRACEYLGEYIQKVRPTLVKDREEQIVFLGIRKMSLSRNMVSSIVVDYAKKSGLKKHITPHSFRHSCATHMLKNRASLRHIQVLLGHKSLETTQKYVRIEITDLKRAHQKYHPLSK